MSARQKRINGHVCRARRGATQIVRAHALRWDL
jgi:hypothetical protein